ncbi:DUF5133 domain-containing protein [Streptomyces sp. NPDC026673]|uniref:DUF5133 domain-containing protein n=1 Tax=Streptomyces sp. NPDC026673 TaxID=3155724 RepID=UPI0033CD0FE2
MLMAHPVVLHMLVERYETLRALNAENGGPEVRHRLEDVAHTLCVATGTRDVGSALAAARRGMPGARPDEHRVRGS